MKKLFWIFVFNLLLPCSVIYALDTNFNPYTEKELEQIKATVLTSDPNTNVRCEIKLTNDSENRMTILYKGQPVYKELFNYWFRYGKPFIADIDGNGFDDVVKNYFHGTQGLGLGCDLLIFSQYKQGLFVKITIPHERFSVEDICDIDGDRKKEIISCVLVKHENHNYWVYRCWRLEGEKLKNIDNSVGFPRAIWFTKKPNSTLVSPEALSLIMKNYPEFENNKNSEPDKTKENENG